jgi:hypothetical protein
MLLTITRAENAEAVAASKSRPSGGGSAAACSSPWDEPQGGARVARGPGRAGGRGREQQQPRDEDQHGPLGQPLPVAARHELAHRAAARRLAVDGAAAGDHERLEPRHDRIARVAAPRVRQIGGGAAVERAELPHPVRSQPLGPAARARQRVLQPPPVLPALGLERCEPH